MAPQVKEPPAELRALVQQTSSRPPSSRGDATARSTVAQSTTRVDPRGSVGAWDFSGDSPGNTAPAHPRGASESWSFSGAPEGSARSSGSGLANTIKGHHVSLSEASAQVRLHVSGLFPWSLRQRPDLTGTAVVNDAWMQDGGTVVIRNTSRRVPRPPALAAPAAATRDSQGFVTHSADDMAAPPQPPVAPSPRNSMRARTHDQGNSIRALHSPRASFKGRPAELQAVPSVRTPRHTILPSAQLAGRVMY